MAVRFDETTDDLRRTSDLLDYRSAFTMMAWLYISADRNSNSFIFTLSHAASFHRSALSLGSDGTTLSWDVYNGSFEAQSGTNLSTATWYHVALVRSSATSLRGYVNGVADGTADATLDVSAATAPDLMQAGNRNDGNQLDGRLAALKAWTTNLSLDEIRGEMRRYRPLRRANLYAWWPCLQTGNVTDHSGRGRDWTITGTVTTEEGPGAVAWGSRRRRAVAVAVTAAPAVSLLPPPPAFLPLLVR